MTGQKWTLPSKIFQSIATPSAELEYVSDRDGGFKQPLERCKLLTRWAFEYFDQTPPCTSSTTSSSHELVHLRYRGHGRDYWQAVGRVMPDYERRREDLKQWGVRLAW